MKKHKICVFVIESEPESQNQIIEILKVNSLISIIESAKDVDEALLKLITINPDLILLEYPTKGKAGKELIKFIKSKNQNSIVAFVSKTKRYATTAIRNGIFNYLLKPVSPEELKRIISKVQLLKQSNINIRVQEIIEKSQEQVRLRFQTVKGYLLVDPQDIIYCKAEGFYTEIYLVGDRVELSYLFISKLEEILQEFKFARISRSYIINSIYIRKLFSGKNPVVLSAHGQDLVLTGSKSKIRMLSKIDSE